MDFLNSKNYQDNVKALKHKPSVYNLPKYITEIIHENDIIDIEDHDERAKIFIKTLYLRNLKAVTISLYFKKLKPHLFPNTVIIPNSLVFDNHYPKTCQVRGGNLENIQNLINYVKNEIPDTCVYKWPIIISSYSGLRLREVCSITMEHIRDLHEKKPIIKIKRKNNKDWRVIYYPQFEKLVEYIITVACKDNYNLYINSFINQKLFPYTPQALHYKLKYYYQLANDGKKPPIGFGLHSIRYFLATVLYETTGKIEIPQALLGHTSQKTTEIYIKNNNLKLKKELEKLYTNNDLYSNIRNIINSGDNHG